MKESMHYIRLLNKHRREGFDKYETFDKEVIGNDPELKKSKLLGRRINISVLICLSIGIFLLFSFVSTNFFEQQKGKKVKAEEEKERLDREIILDALQKELLIRQINNPKRYH